jgi:hypothetical protein
MRELRINIKFWLASYPDASVHSYARPCDVTRLLGRQKNYDVFFFSQSNGIFSGLTKSKSLSAPDSPPKTSGSCVSQGLNC